MEEYVVPFKYGKIKIQPLSVNAVYVSLVDCVVRGISQKGNGRVELQNGAWGVTFEQPYKGNPYKVSNFYLRQEHDYKDSTKVARTAIESAVAHTVTEWAHTHPKELAEAEVNFRDEKVRDLDRKIEECYSQMDELKVKANELKRSVLERSQRSLGQREPQASLGLAIRRQLRLG